jgi:hypothetical protein
LERTVAASLAVIASTAAVRFAPISICCGKPNT